MSQPPPNALPGDLPVELAEARRLGELLLEVATDLERMIAASARAEGLTALEARLLRYVIEALPQYELAKHLGVDAARITHLVRRLRALGFVSREVDRSDRRVRVIQATEAGHAASERIGDRITAASPLLRDLSRPQRAHLMRLLTKLRPGSASLDAP